MSGGEFSDSQALVTSPAESSLGAFEGLFVKLQKHENVHKFIVEVLFLKFLENY